MSAVETHFVKTREGYDRWAAVYDQDENPLTALEGPILRQMLGPVEGLTVLDLGCGTGRHCLPLAHGGARVTALDFSAGMLAQARSKPGAQAVTFVQHDLTQRLPFDQPFDRVISSLVLEHIPELGHFFAEARRLCRGGGEVVMSAMHPAMFLKGTQAGFVDPQTRVKTHPQSYPHQICDFLNAAVSAQLELREIREFQVTQELAQQKPRAAKYLGWPMLLMLRLGVRA